MAKMMVEVYQCEFCKKPIMGGSMIGAGDGTGDSFAHPDCYERARELEKTIHPSVCVDVERAGSSSEVT